MYEELKLLCTEVSISFPKYFENQLHQVGLKLDFVSCVVHLFLKSESRKSVTLWCVVNKSNRRLLGGEAKEMPETEGVGITCSAVRPFRAFVD